MEHIGRIKTGIRQGITRLPGWIWLIAGVYLIGLAYYYIRAEMLGYEGTYTAVISPVTFNLILVYGIWGYESHRRTKNKAWWIRWGVFLGGCALLTLVFRMGFGIKTIFG